MRTHLDQPDDDPRHAWEPEDDGTCGRGHELDRLPEGAPYCPRCDGSWGLERCPTCRMVKYENEPCYRCKGDG